MISAYPIDEKINCRVLAHNMASELEVDNLVRACARVTKGFTEFTQSTIQGWVPTYDTLGRILNCDPNHMSRIINLGGVNYSIVRHGWEVGVYHTEKGRGRLNNKTADMADSLVYMDTRPEYLGITIEGDGPVTISVNSPS